jgi:hypothetical protein
VRWIRNVITGDLREAVGCAKQGDALSRKFPMASEGDYVRISNVGFVPIVRVCGKDPAGG